MFLGFYALNDNLTVRFRQEEHRGEDYYVFRFYRNDDDNPILTQSQGWQIDPYSPTGWLFHTTNLSNDIFSSGHYWITINHVFEEQETPIDSFAFQITGNQKPLPIKAEKEEDFSPIKVDENFNGPGSLRIETKDKKPIKDANIVVFKREDYKQGKMTSADIVDKTTTDEDGNWKNPIYLKPGEYILEIYKTGVFEVFVQDISVSNAIKNAWP